MKTENLEKISGKYSHYKGKEYDVFCEETNLVIIHQLSETYSSGYLTEYEIYRRLGYISCRINGVIKYYKSSKKVAELFALRIGNNNIDSLKSSKDNALAYFKIAPGATILTQS